MKYLLPTITLSILTVLSACTNTSSSLVGRWAISSCAEVTDQIVIDLKSDGSYRYIMYNSVDDHSDSMTYIDTYSITNDTLRLQIPGNPTPWAFSVTSIHDDQVELEMIDDSDFLNDRSSCMHRLD